MAEAADVEVDRIPVGLANMVAGGIGLRGFGNTGLANREPIRVLEESRFVERLERVVRVGHEENRNGKGRKTQLETSNFKDRKSTRLNSSHEWISYAVF